MANLFDCARSRFSDATREGRTPVNWSMHPRTLTDMLKERGADGIRLLPPWQDDIRLIGLPVVPSEEVTPGRLVLRCADELQPEGALKRGS